MNIQGFYINTILRNESNSDQSQFDKEFETLLKEEKDLHLEENFSENSLDSIREKFKGKTGQVGQGAGIYSTIRMDTAQKIIKAVANKKKIDIDTAMVLITGLAQSGGANKNSNCSYKVLETTLSASELLQIIHKEKKEGTNRQFFRCIRDRIVEIALVIEEEGDLAGQLRLDLPTASLEEAVWCSSFQTTNPKCPDSTRIWLVHNHQRRFKP